MFEFSKQTHTPDSIVTPLLQVDDLPLDLQSARATLGNLAVGILQMRAQSLHVQYLSRAAPFEFRRTGAEGTQWLPQSIRRRSLTNRKRGARIRKLRPPSRAWLSAYILSVNGSFLTDEIGDEPDKEARGQKNAANKTAGHCHTAIEQPILNPIQRSLHVSRLK